MSKTIVRFLKELKTRKKILTFKGQHPTQFDEEDEGMEEEMAPGAFKRPKSAYKLAR